MARNQGPSDDPFYRRGAARNPFADDALPLDAGLTEEDDTEEEQQQFRRVSKRVPVRRGALPKKTASRVRSIVTSVLALAVIGFGIYEARSFATHTWRFRVRSASDLELAGDAQNSRAQVMEKMREDMGRNVFQISLRQRKEELEKIPWVESASVARLWPNHVRVVVKERTPVAFVAIGERVELIDSHGVLMEMPQGVESSYSFPVILGMTESEPLSTRVPRMKTYMRLIHELDEGEGNGAAKTQYSRNLDEVDLSDPGDVKVLARGGSSPILLHLGDENFLQRFMVFLSNVQRWEQDRGKLESVDLRYGREVFANFDTHAAAPATKTPPEVAKPAAPQKQEPAKAKKPWHKPKKKRK